MEPTVINCILLAVVGFGAAFVQRVSGFGLGIFAMLFLPFLMGNTAAAASVSCLWSCVTSVYNAVKYRRHIDLRLILPLLGAAMVTIPVAVHFSSYVPQQLMTAVLGGVLIVLSLYFLFFSHRVRIRPTVINGILTGGIGGALNGLFSTGGPPVVLYLAGATEDKLVYFASIQLYFAATNIYATAMRAFSGIITREILFAAAVGVLGCLLGDTVGKLVFNHLNAKRFKQLIYIGMIVSGVLMVI